MAGKKNRGVIGSRAKLEAALAASDLPKKTQTALAEAIADYEELDAAPKDLVSKLFRELPVDPQTIERVARILKVDAQSLYRAEDEAELIFSNGGNNTQASTNSSKRPPQKTGKGALLLFFGVVLIIGVGIIEIFKPFTQGNTCNGLIDSGLTTPEKSLGIIISRFAGDEHNEVQIMLARFFTMDEKLAKSIEVFTSCHRFDSSRGQSFKNTLHLTREKAKRDLEAVDAHIYIWGERYKNRLNLHFVTKRKDEAVRLRLEDNLVKTRETNFTLPVTMTADRPFPVSLKQIVFDILYPETDERISLRKKIATSFQSSSNWLKESIEANRNLLRTISPARNPDLYTVTGGQLCYQYRLLGEFDNSASQFKQAENFCRQVISHISKKDNPYEWGTMHLNLGTVLIRRHLFAKTTQERFQILESAKEAFEEAKGTFDPDIFPGNFTVLHQNYAMVFLRLAEITSGEASVKYLEQAITNTEASLQILNPEKQPFRYSQTIQNLCVIKFRYAEKTKDIEPLNSGIENCQKAISLLSFTTEPQAWGMAQNNLAVSYAVLADIKKDPAIFQKSLAEYSKAQQAYTHKDFPANWAEVEANKSELYCRLSLMTEDADLLPVSLKHGEAALQIFTEKGIKRYADYTESLLQKVRACDPLNMDSCVCSE